MYRYTGPAVNAIEAAESAGIDLSLIEESLRLTPEQRALQHQAALEMALQLETAYKEALGRQKDLIVAQELRAIVEKSRGR